MPPSTPLILVQSRQTELGVCGTALSWFKSNWEERSQIRICIKETHAAVELKMGCPSRFLSQTAFVYYLYTRLVLFSGVTLANFICDADDTQLYLSCSSNISTGEARALIAIESCIRDIRLWMCESSKTAVAFETSFFLAKPTESPSFHGRRF